MALIGSIVQVKILSADSPCPNYNIYYDQIGSNFTAATNVSFATLQTGISVQVPESATTILLSGTCGQCPVVTKVISTTISFRVANDTSSVCTAGISLAYVSKSVADIIENSGFQSGMILYQDNLLSIPFQNYNYIIYFAGFNVGLIYSINPSTGEIGVSVSNC
jgi:hypothetical protein